MEDETIADGLDAHTREQLQYQAGLFRMSPEAYAAKLLKDAVWQAGQKEMPRRCRPIRSKPQFELTVTGKQISLAHNVQLEAIHVWCDRGEFAWWYAMPSGRIEIPITCYLEFLDRHGMKDSWKEPERKKQKLAISEREIARVHNVEVQTVRSWARKGEFRNEQYPSGRQFELPLPAYLKFRDRRMLKRPPCFR
jgi:hypothetical protein